MLQILLIDDEPMIIKDILDVYGYRVTSATDGFQGLQILYDRQSHFDLIILDLKMPVLDGWQVLKNIREKQEYEDIPIIMLTCCAEEDHLVAGLRRGADEYLTKPISPRKLIAYIEAFYRRLQQTDRGKMCTELSLLTLRENEILGFVSQGLSNLEIGERLSISETTVKNHLARIFKKMKVSNRTQAAFIAQQMR